MKAAKPRNLLLILVLLLLVGGAAGYWILLSPRGMRVRRARLALQNRPAAAGIFRQVLAMDPGNNAARGSLKWAEGE